MDCEKCEPLLLDELYGELDELTSAAVRRHVGGCARCGGILNGMKATRKLVSLPLVEVPVGLEDRILAAAAEAQKVVPIKSRLSRTISWAGAWAMRPQTAMAAVFLLMIGSTTLLLRNNSRSESAATAPVTVTQRGEPGVVGNEDTSRLDIAAASSAHGLLEKSPAPLATAAPAVAASAVSQTVALADPATPSTEAVEGEKKADKGKREEQQGQGGLGRLAFADDETNAPKDVLNAGPLAGAGRAAAPPPPPAARGPGGSTDGDGYLKQQPARDRAGADDSFQRGVAAYRSSRFGEAAKSFDQAAQTGDRNAALWAAKSVKASSGCAAAAPRFDAVSSTADPIGQEALFEAAECYRAMGQTDAARARYQRLAAVAAYAARAQAGIDAMNQVASRKATGGPPKAAAAAPQPAAKPAATATAPAQVDDKANKAATDSSY